MYRMVHAKKFTMIIILSIAFLVIGLISGIIWVKSNSATTYTIPHKVCVALFAEKPTEFIKNADNWAPWTNDFCVNAKIDGQGNLLLTLNEKQKNQWRSQFSAELSKAQKTDGIVISDDYTQFSYSRTQKTEVALDAMLVYKAFYGCFVNQLLNGVEPENMHIDFIVFEKQTNEVLYQAKWPEEEVQFNYIGNA